MAQRKKNHIIIPEIMPLQYVQKVSYIFVDCISSTLLDLADISTFVLPAQGDWAGRLYMHTKE
jgi:hypothetical protein